MAAFNFGECALLYPKRQYIFYKIRNIMSDPISAKTPTLASYRKAALEHYRREVGEQGFNLCVVCGFGVQAVLEVAHLDQDRKNNAVENLAVLCPNCHKMHDIDLIPTEVVRCLRDHPKEENWKLRIKDAGAKAAATRGAKRVAAKKSASAKKAWASRINPQPSPSSGEE